MRLWVSWDNDLNGGFLGCVVSVLCEIYGRRRERNLVDVDNVQKPLTSKSSIGCSIGQIAF